MGIKTYNPYTPSRRNMTGSDFSEITKKTPEKSLCYSRMMKLPLKVTTMTILWRGLLPGWEYRVIVWRTMSCLINCAQISTGRFRLA